MINMWQIYVTEISPLREALINFIIKKLTVETRILRVAQQFKRIAHFASVISGISGKIKQRGGVTRMAGISVHALGCRVGMYVANKTVNPNRAELLGYGAEIILGSVFKLVVLF